MPANQIGAFNAQTAADKGSGWGSALGSIAGAGMGFMGMPTNSIGGKLFGFADGGAVPAVGGAPQNAGAVPMGASPSNGAITDDVPARLNAGEFIIYYAPGGGGAVRAEVLPGID
ncbi:MAG: hypothetical protein FWD68_07340 [Alphaproteobacteria bacterium]|nr:hypothetical protein [Alphaproteobacteria bacterium]